jgi:hypothetical protein
MIGHGSFATRQREFGLDPSTDIAELTSYHSCWKKARDNACSRWGEAGMPGARATIFIVAGVMKPVSAPHRTRHLRLFESDLHTLGG